MQEKLKKTLEILEMSRGTVVVDENISNIAPFLEKKGIRVRMPPKGMSDEKIAEDYLPNRIFIRYWYYCYGKCNKRSKKSC